MRLNINLASQPYEVAREYKRRMTVLIAALAVVAVALLGYILYQRAHSRGINRQLADVQAQIDSLNHEESQARAILNKPANHVIADQSEFLNELFARKAMSWTHIFTVMEKIVPPQLHVVSMKPEYSKTNDLVLHVVVATDSRDRAVEMVRNMDKSSHFRQPQVVAENRRDQHQRTKLPARGNYSVRHCCRFMCRAGRTATTDRTPDEPGGEDRHPRSPRCQVNRAQISPGGNARQTRTSPAPCAPGN